MANNDSLVSFWTASVLFTQEFAGGKAAIASFIHAIRRLFFWANASKLSKIFKMSGIVLYFPISATEHEIFFIFPGELNACKPSKNVFASLREEISELKLRRASILKSQNNIPCLMSFCKVTMRLIIFSISFCNFSTLSSIPCVTRIASPVGRLKRLNNACNAGRLYSFDCSRCLNSSRV